MSTLRSIRRPNLREVAKFLLSPETPFRSSRCPIHHINPRSVSPKAARTFSSSRYVLASTKLTKSQTHDRGPKSTEDTQTDFGTLDVLGNTPPPSTSIDACLWDGFHLNSGAKIVGGTGVLLIGNDAFAWKPWEAGNRELKLVNSKGQWEVPDEAWGFLELVWPKPDLLILGLGKEMRPLSPKTSQYVHSLGIRIDIQDTRNAAAQFNLLATERGSQVAAALIPLGWEDGVGVN